MIVAELMDALAQRFPRLARGWAEDYRAALGAHEGEALAAAFGATMAVWTRSSPPRPADLAAHLPRATPTAAHPREPTDATREAWAETVMRSEAGQAALRAGYARPLWIWAKQHPDAPPPDAAIAACIADRDRMVAMIAATGDDGRTPGSRVVRAMRDFETFLRRMYLRDGSRASGNKDAAA